MTKASAADSSCVFAPTSVITVTTILEYRFHSSLASRPFGVAPAEVRAVRHRLRPD